MKRILAGQSHRGVTQMKQGIDMRASSRIANVSECNDFGIILQFCASELVLSLMFLIAVRLTLAEWPDVFREVRKCAGSVSGQ